MILFFKVGQTAPRWAKGLLIIQAYRLHSNTPHLVLLLWTRERLIAETCVKSTHHFTGDSHTRGGIRTRNPSKGLSPCDFDLIPKMKEPLRGIRFRTVPKILQAVDRSIRTINTTDAAEGILRLPHRWQRVVHNAGDCIEGQ